MTSRFLLNKRDGKIMGVAAGLADLTNVDPLLIRLGLVVLAFATFPVVPILYVLTGWLASSR
ncbi:PspC domain-containing protein [Sphingomonas piscis]|uniref:PspC domain-containing protein n=1 Tax=Sphingomonas piscis TaxID=2714943 RepID=A0A6G7YPE8_9SPHN|nr:PspC domain-containing protein [Sphingomonas piscis]QIK78611.1 PspC domain-containing protein [Sphingomonas piscis]